MSSLKLIRIVVLSIALILGGQAHAQRIKAEARVDSSRILLGDQVKLFLEVNHPRDVQVIFPEVPDTLGRFEVLERSGIDTVALADKKLIQQIQAYTITCFDSGEYRIPPFWFKVDLEGHLDSVPSNGVSIHVASLPIDTTKGPTDIKMPYDAPLTLKEVTPYILGVILIGALLFFLIYSLRRRKNNQPLFARPEKPKEPAHIIALRELDRIKESKIWQKGRVKEYYSELTDVIRTYIEDRFGIPAMEQTTADILQRFAWQKGLISEKETESLKMLLELADLVKFAKYKPLPDDNELALVKAYFFVNDTKKEVPQALQENDDDDNVEEVEIK